MIGSRRGNRPVVIAHRGASGYLPEHSLPAKALAYGQGADYLEQDIVASRDGELLVLHDLYLDCISDVADRFPGRQRADGHYYCIDFDLEEIKSLRLSERVSPHGEQQYPGRYPHDATPFRICTLSEELGFVAGLNRATGRPVGVYPEIKSPAWHREQGIDLTPKILATLDQFGYLEPGKAIFLQCYEADELKRMHAECGASPALIQLLSSRSLPDEELLDGIADYAAGIGPSTRLIITGRFADGVSETTALVQQARDRGLAVHPYTLRKDDIPDPFKSFNELLDLFLGRLGVDGVFTDFPDLVSAWIRVHYGRRQ